MSWTSDPKVFPENEQDFPHYAGPATLQTDPGAGSVELQHRNAAGAWVAFEAITEPGVQKIDVANMPAIRLATTGGAKYRLTWKLA